jgi:hypothetical protein
MMTYTYVRRINESYYSPSLIQIAARVPEPGTNKLSEFKTISFLFWLFDRHLSKKKE